MAEIIVNGAPIRRRENAGCSCSNCELYFSGACPGFYSHDSAGNVRVSRRRRCPSWTPVSQKRIAQLEKETF